MKFIALAIIASMAAIVVGATLLIYGPSSIPPVISDAHNLPDNFGIIVNSPSSETSIVMLDELYASVGSLGASRSNVYVFWDTFEPQLGQYNWTVTDAIMSLHAKYDLDATVFFSIVNSKTFGPLPQWMGRPTLDALPADDVALAISTIALRYPQIVDSVIMAGDADRYFETNSEMVEPYNELFDSVRAKLLLTNPDLKIGNAFSLDRVLNRGTHDIVDSISTGDFVAFTYRPVNVLNEISKDPQKARADLDEMSSIAGGAPVALFEVGWSTSDVVGGSEADQASFVSELIEFAQTTDTEFVTWYRLYDKPEGTCKISTSPDEGILSTDEGVYAASNLGSYLCNSGLFDQLGGKKAAWRALDSQ